MKKSNSRLFWILNLTSWAIFYLSQGTTSPTFLSIEAYTRFTLICIFIFWIMLSTSSYRFIYRYFRFDEKSSFFTVIQSIVSALLIWGFDIFARFSINPFLYLLFFPEGKDTFGDNIFAEISKLILANPKYAPYQQAELITGQVSKLMAIAVWVAV